MSLINTLLQDLEQRQATTGYEPISGEVRSVMKARNRTTWVISGMFVIPVVAAAALWVLTTGSSSSPSMGAAPAPRPVAAKAAAPAPAPAPVVVAEAVPATPALLAPLEMVKVPTAPVIPALMPPVARATPKAAELEVKTVAMLGVLKKPVAGAAPAAAAEPAADKPPVKPVAVALADTGSQKTVSPQQLSDNLYKRAVLLTQQGHAKEARQALAESLVAVPRNAPARQLLVSLLVEANLLNEASALLREGVKLSPEHSGLWMSLARLQLENADTSGATQTLELGLPSAVEDGPYLAFYAALMQRAGRHDEAVKHYVAALRIDPGMPKWLVGVGISLQALGRETDAAEAFQRAKDGGQLPPAFIAFVDQRLSQLKR